MADSESVETPSLVAQQPPTGPAVWLSRLFAPVEIDFLVYFRIAFGTIMLWEMWRYIEGGRVKRFFIDPTLHFTFFGFSWVRPWPDDGMHWHFYLMAVLAVCITLGMFYRVSAALFCLLFTYIFLIDQAYYLNHFYLVCLISFLMIFVPAHQAFSLDALLRRQFAKSPRPSPHSLQGGPPAAEAAADGSYGQSVIPAWTLWILRVPVAIVYFYGAIAKMNMDWLTGNPMRIMLADADTYPVLGRFFHLEPVILFYSYAGLLLDLLIVPALIWKCTRLPALLAAAFFHLSNDQMFQIGIFPWFMLASTLLLWPPKKIELLWLSRTALGAVYIYACMAMMNTAWEDDAVVRSLAMLLGMACLPLLLWKPVRIPAFLAAAAWLLIGPRYFGTGEMPDTLISILPGLILWAVIVVFPPDFLRNFQIVSHETESLSSAPDLPASSVPLTGAKKLTVGLLGLFVAVQCLVPFRHWLYAGSVHWTEEGHLFAWHMKLRYKDGRATFRATTGAGTPIPLLLAGGYLIGAQDEDGNLTHILDANGNPLYSLTMRGERILALDAGHVPVFELNRDGWLIYEVDPHGERLFPLDSNGRRSERTSGDPPRDPPYYLIRRQRGKMAERPEMLLQYAHFLAAALRRQGYEDVEIRADVFCSLNGREEQRLIDPTVNLAAVRRSLGHADWILPLDPTAEPGVLYKRELSQSDDLE